MGLEMLAIVRETLIVMEIATERMRHNSRQISEEAHSLPPVLMKHPVTVILIVMWM